MTQRLDDRITAAFVWTAAFCCAAGVFLSITLLFGSFPPTKPIAIGLVTIERYSKLRDYAAAALFFLLVPPLTVWLDRLFRPRAFAMRTLAERALFTLPWLLAPFLYLTTGKAGWILLLPAFAAEGAPRALRFFASRRWVRELLSRDEGPWHALLFCAAAGWILFRYLVTGRYIAHIETLFLEIVFVALFLALFWAAAILVARVTELAFGIPGREAFRRIAFGSLPVSLLPLLAIVVVPLPNPRLFVAAAMAIGVLMAVYVHVPRPAAARRLAAWWLIPGLVYVFSYASTARLSEWIDLFHRGEAIGPASDYLRGRAPYSEIFPLHGLLEDGLLDAWLMQLFGRSLDVAMMRTVVIGALLGPALWYLGLVVFRTIPLALLCVAIGSWTTAENNRTFFQVAAVALFWVALSRRRPLAAAASGAIAGLALFFSLDIGLYTIAGGLATAVLLALVSRRVAWDGLSPVRAALWFVAGLLAGTAPFLVYLGARGVLGEFARVSFVTIPAVIDAVWSLPFPDLVTPFRDNLRLDTIAEFVLREKFHLILSPLTIAIAAVYLIVRWLHRRLDRRDCALLVLGVFALIAQRTAFGRAEFRHQYFAAFLIGPMLVLLGLALARSLAETWREGNRGTRAFVAALVTAMLPVVATLFWIPDLINARLHDLTRFPARVLRVERDAHAEEVSWRIKDVAAALRELTPRGEPVFDFSNQPAFYFFADRPNPTRFYQVPILSPRNLQAEAIAAIEQAKTKVIIRRSPELFDQFDGVPNELRAQALARYIDDMYEFHRSVRGVELWTRRAGRKARPMAEYLAAIRLPDRKELVSGAPSRLLFPAVGSLEGMGGSRWRSDLTLHNPFKEPIPVTLRLVAGGRGSQRHLTLAAHQTIRWVDVLVSLFGVQNQVGTLWIEHREGRPPVAIVKTADVAHAARASVERPLTYRDTATAGSATPELAIVGIPEGVEGRRVNIGMVNVGRIPATFRVGVTSRDGARVGRTIESGVAEEQLWVVNGAEGELGAKLDETTIVRIEMIAGSGVAYATVVSPNGDAEIIPATPAELR